VEVTEAAISISFAQDNYLIDVFSLQYRFAGHPKRRRLALMPHKFFVFQARRADSE
jgi:hypothetical protein